MSILPQCCRSSGHRCRRNTAYSFDQVRFSTILSVFSMAQQQAMNFLEKGLKKFHLPGSHPEHQQQPMQADEPRNYSSDEQPQRAGRFERGQRTPVYPQPGQVKQCPGHMPPKVANLDYRGKMKFFKPNGEPHQVMRDLGFSGVIDGKIVWCWGDTLMGTQKKNFICANDSTVLSCLTLCCGPTC